MPIFARFVFARLQGQGQMKRILFICVLLCIFCGRANANPDDARARQILAQAFEKSHDYRDQEARGVLKSVTKSGQVSTREIFSRSLKAGNNEGRILLKVLAPVSLKGFGYLSYGDDQNWVYLPAFQKTKRIAGQQKMQSFAGSDFSFHDLGALQVSGYHDFNHAQQPCDKVSCHVITARVIDRSVGVTKKRFFVTQKDNRLVQIDSYDSKDQLVKKLFFERYELVQNKLVPKQMRIEVQDGGFSTFEIKSIMINQGLSLDDVNRRWLQKDL